MSVFTSLVGRWAYAKNDAPRHELYVKEMGRSQPNAGLKRQIDPRDVYVFHYCVSGHGKFNGITIRPGKGFLIYPGDDALIEIDENDPYEHYWIMVTGTNLPKILEECGVENKTHVFSCGFFEELRDDFDNVLSTQQSNSEIPFDYPLMMHGIFYKLLSYHAAMSKSVAEQRKSNYVEAAMEFIKFHYGENIDIEDIAEAIHISSRYMYKLFMRELGKSPKQTLTDYRLKRAAYLLTTSQISVGEIAHRVGYTEQGQLSAAFKQTYGMSPSCYRSLEWEKSSETKE